MTKHKLSDDQTEHLFDIIDAFANKVEPKYREGAKEHGGNIWDMSNMKLLDEAINEAIDQFTYLYTLRQKLTK